MTRADLILATHAADQEGFTNLAQALRELYAREFGNPTTNNGQRTTLFPTVTGADFGRSIAWAHAQPAAALSNEGIRHHVAAHKAREAGAAPCSH